MEGEEDEPAQLEEFYAEEEEEEWCFVCKDGGDLILCDYKNCPKAYHHRCVRKSRASLNSEEEHWECAWHSCYYCKNPSYLRCYVCPKSVCNSCMNPDYFFHIKGKYGLCNDCRELAVVTEPVDDEELSTRKLHFKEYYVLVKKREGFDLNDLISAKKSQMKKSQNPTFKNVNDIDRSVVSKKDVEDKRCEGLGKRRIDYVDVSDEEDVLMQSGPETSFAAIIAENISLVYLTKSLVLELLKQPESFDSKVEGSFVRVKSDLVNGGDFRSTNSYQLVQVVGVTKEEDSTSTVKLQLVNVPCDVSIDLLSDAQFSENECEFLRQNVEDGLLNKPTIEELEHKARDLHCDLTKNMIARELKTLPNLIDLANEKGRRLKLVEYLERKERLENESEVNRMMNTPPKVIAEISKVEPVAVNTIDDDKMRKKSRSLPKSREISIDLEDAYKIKSNKLQGIKSTFPNHTGCVVEDDVMIQEPVSHPIELQCNKTTSEKTSPKNFISCNSSLDDEALSKMLDGLNRPSNDVANRSFVSVPSKAIDHIQKGCILSLKEIPISNYKELMIPIAKGFFDTLCSLDIDYTRLYVHVKEYIRSSARLAHIDHSNNSLPSVEELTAEYESRKSCYEKSSNAFNEISKSLHTEPELSRGRSSEHVSRLSRMVEMSEEMEKSKKEMLEALNALDDRRKKWLEEEKVKEEFMNAKAALDW